MRLGKKIIGIVMSAFTLLLAVLFLIMFINGMTKVIDNATYLTGLSHGTPSEYFEPYLKVMAVDIVRMVTALALTIICAITGGINLKKAIKGAPEAMWNRLALFVVFDFCGVAAALTSMFANIDTMKGEYIASIIAYAITMLAMIIGISVVSTMARRRYYAPGRKLAAGIMLAVVSTLMATFLIIEGAAAGEIVTGRYSSYEPLGETVKNLYTSFELIAVFVGIFGTSAFAALTIVEAILEKRSGVQPAKAEVKEEAKPEEK